MVNINGAREHFRIHSIMSSTDHTWTMILLWFYLFYVLVLKYMLFASCVRFDIFS